MGLYNFKRLFRRRGRDLCRTRRVLLPARVLLSLDERAHHRSPPDPATDNPINSGIFHVYAPPTLCCTFNVASTNIYRAIQRFSPPPLFFSFSIPLFFLSFLSSFPPPPLPLSLSSLLPYSIGCKSLTIVVGILARKSFGLVRVVETSGGTLSSTCSFLFFIFYFSIVSRCL